MDFSRAPFLVIWETTRSCALACRHCRAEAIPHRDPGELGREEAKGLLRQTAAMGTPIFVFSGGDPLNREDLEELIACGKGLGLRLGAIPAAGPNLDEARLRALKAAGLDQLAVSLDAPSAEPHDAFRGAPGAFARALEGARSARRAGLALQVNTCFARWNLPHLEAMLALVRELGAVFWEVFFLVPVGRGRDMAGLRPEEFEAVFARLHRAAREERFIVKVTEAQHYRRHVFLAEAARGAGAAGRARDALARPRGAGGSIGMSPEAVNSGKGFLFVDHLGNICPSGFLPIPCGNVRRDALAEVYRGSPVFRALRDPSRLGGKCGRCEFARLCGGSRARAWAVTGDFLAEDPSCAHLPARP